MKYLTTIKAALVGVAAFFFGRWLSDRKEKEITRQRDEALVNSAQQKIKAEAGRRQAEVQQQQQKREEEVHAADSDTIATKLDDMFK